MIMTDFQGHLESSIKAGANTKVLLSTRLMVDLDTPEDLRLVLSKDASAKKSISYLWKIKKDHFGASSASATVKTGTNTRKNPDSSDLPSTSARDLQCQ